MIGSLFGRNAAKNDTLVKLLAAQTRSRELAREHETVMAVIAARTQAQLDWIESGAAKIRNSYMDLQVAFEKEDRRAVAKAVSRLGDAGAAVLSMPALDADYRPVSFTDWVDLLPGNDGGRLKRTLVRAIASAKIPAFEDIAAQPLSLPGVSGPGQETIRREIADPEPALPGSLAENMDKEKAYALAERKTAARGGRKVENALAEIASEMQTAIALARLNRMLRGQSGEAAGDFLKTGISFLASHYGINETISFLVDGDENSSAPSLVLLAKSDPANPGEAGRPFSSLLDALPNGLARAMLLKRTAGLIKNTQTGKLLEIMAAQATGDFVRAGRLSLFAPAQAGCLYEKEGEIKFQSFSKKTKLKTDAQTGRQIVDYLDTLETVFRFEGNRHEIGETAYIHYDPDKQKLNIAYKTDAEDCWYVDFKDDDPETARKKAVKAVSHFAGDGRFFLPGEATAVQKKAIDLAWAEPAGKDRCRLVCVIQGRKKNLTDVIERGRALEMLDALAQDDDGVMFLLNGAWVRPEKLSGARISRDENGSLLCLVLDGYTYSLPMKADAAYAHLHELKKMPGFVKTGDNEVLRPARAALIFWNAGDERLNYISGGQRCEARTRYDRFSATGFMDDLGETHPSLIRLQDRAVINPDLLSRVTLGPAEKKILYVTAAQSWQSDALPESAELLSQALQERPFFIQLDGKTYLNLSRTSLLDYNAKEGRLEYVVDGDTGRWTEMPYEQALRVIEAAEAWGREQALDRVKRAYEDAELEPFSLSVPPPEPVAGKPPPPPRQAKNESSRPFGADLIDIFEGKEKPVAPIRPAKVRQPEKAQRKQEPDFALDLG